MSGVRQADEIKILTVRDFDSLRTHEDAWDDLAWNSPLEVPTLLPDWVKSFLRNRLASTEMWFCSFAYANNKLVGVLPIIIARHPIFGMKKPLLRTPFDATTPSGDILLAPQYATAALKALLAEVDREAPGHLGLDFSAVHQASPLWTALEANSGKYVLHHGRKFTYSYIDVKENPESYFSKMGNLRRNLKRYRKKLDGRGVVSVDIEIGPAVGKQSFEHFLRLEASGWKGRNGTAILQDPSSIAFYNDIVRDFAARDRLEWHIIRLDDQFVVVEMGVRCGKTLFLPKIAFDENFSEFTPGNLLTGEVIKDAFTRSDITAINHMSDFEWHRAWQMPRYENINVHLVDRSMAAGFFHYPLVAIRVALHGYVWPRLPSVLKAIRRKMQRRGDRKPRRAADSRGGQLEQHSQKLQSEEG